MAIKTKTGYACGYCKKEYKGQTAISDANNCKESHNLIYIQLSKEDLHRLLMFIFSKDDSVLSETIVERLQAYLKTSFDLAITKKADKEMNSGSEKV